MQKYGLVSLALYESNDIGSTAQLLIFIRGVTENFQISEELLAMVSLKDRTRGSDLCDAVSDVIDKSNKILLIKAIVSVSLCISGWRSLQDRKSIRSRYSAERKNSGEFRIRLDTLPLYYSLGSTGGTCFQHE